MSCQTYNNTINKFKLPFPPTIDPNDIVEKRKPCKVKSKGPNAFLIYRKAFLDHLSHLKCNLKMTDVSKLVSKYWEDESNTVKDAYRDISKKVEELLVERRKKTVSNRLIWKNSSTRKRNRLEKKTTKVQKIKSPKINTEVIHSNRNYQFISTFPDTITSSSSQKHDTEVTLINEPSTPPENIQNPQLNYCQEFIYNPESYLNQFYFPCYDLQIVENPITTPVIDEGCLQNFLNCYQFYEPCSNLSIYENPQQQFIQEETSLSAKMY
ncbi:unnamed protein product [Rhizophagus irregularis]|nr:unnamed protein product [Rhizophagus irregularis]